MTLAELQAVIRGMVPAVKDHVALVVADLKGLPARMKALEDRPAPELLLGPKGDPGERGDDGDPGPPGPPARDGRDGLPGLPGISGEKGRDGRDGDKGQDGLDGLGFDDLDLLHDGERRVTFKFSRADRTKELTVVFPTVIYRGVFKAGERYERGDMVTWAGSTWIAQQDTSAKPGESSLESRAWVLAVKKGSDGKAGAEGKQGPTGPRGESGPMQNRY